MGSVYLLTVRQLAGGWRVGIMTVLAAMPVAITALILQGSQAPTVGEFEQFVISAMLAGSITPLVVLAIATPAFANEMEDRTLANLTLAPIPRWMIALPKLLAAISVAGPFMAGSALLTSLIAFNADLLATAAVTVSTLVAVVLYASAFVWLGLVTTQSVGVGLLYIVLWEGFFSGFVSGVRVLSIRHYAIAWMHGMDARRFAAADNLGFATAALVTLVVAVGFCWLTTRRLRRMDVP